MFNIGHHVMLGVGQQAGAATAVTSLQGIAIYYVLNVSFKKAPSQYICSEWHRDWGYNPLQHAVGGEASVSFRPS